MLPKSIPTSDLSVEPPDHPPRLLPQKDGRTHFPGLDGLRGVAVLLVLVVHTLPEDFYPAHTNWRTFIYLFLQSTGFGVHLFFVLSGFLITGILLDARNSPHYYRSFFGRRIVRIFPLYYGTILAFWLLARFRGFQGDALFLHRLPWLLTYGLNCVIAWRGDWSFIFGRHSLAHFWSLAVEEQFYFFWPTVVLLCSNRALQRICLFAFPLALAWRVISVYGLDNPLCAMVALPGCADSLALGAGLAALVRSDREWRVPQLARPCIFIGAAIWLVSCLDVSVLKTVGISGFAVMSVGLLAACLYSPLGAWLANPLLRTFGKYSYGIYVLHVLILPYLRVFQSPLGLVGFYVFFSFTSLGVAWLSWHLYEMHFLKLKRFFPTGTPHAWTPSRREGSG